MVKMFTAEVISWDKLNPETKKLLHSIKDEELDALSLIDKACIALGAETLLSIHEKKEVLNIFGSTEENRQLILSLQKKLRELPFGLKVHQEGNTNNTTEKKTIQNNPSSPGVSRKQIQEKSVPRDYKDVCEDEEEVSVEELWSHPEPHQAKDNIKKENDLLGEALDEKIFE